MNDKTEYPDDFGLGSRFKALDSWHALRWESVRRYYFARALYNLLKDFSQRMLDQGVYLEGGQQ